MLSFSTKGQNKSAAKNFQKAINAFALDKPEEGWVYLERSMEKADETYYQPFIYAGDRATKEGKFKKAIRFYDGSLERQVIYSTYLKKSRVERYLFKWDPAIADLERYLSSPRLSRDRKKAGEQELANLKFIQQNHGEFIASGAQFDIKKLPFSDGKMEYFPCISGDGKALIFTARDMEAMSRDENLFQASKSGNSWDFRAVPLLGALNSPGNEGAATISADGNTMVFTACDRPGGEGSCDLYISEYLGSKGWGRPKLIQGKVNTPSWESQPSLGPDGATLYFVRGGHSQSPDHDIFVAKRDEEGYWSDVNKLPAEINTKKRESSPFIHFDGTSLYFSSERAPSIGGSDFFVSRKLSDSTWSTPENLGFPINGFSDEFSLVIDHKGEKGYFASNREGLESDFTALSPELDLYEFTVPEHVRPNPTAYFNAKVIDQQTKNKVPGAAVKVYTIEENIVVYNGRSSATGMLRPMLKTQTVYGFTISASGYLPFSKSFRLEGDQDEVLILELVPAESGSSFLLNNVLFALDRSDLLPASSSDLNALLDVLVEHPEWNIQVIGHTDNQGTASYNLKLSKSRAEAVKSWLIQRGIQEDRITTRGAGLSEPIAPNDTEEGRAQNRRTEIKLR